MPYLHADVQIRLGKLEEFKRICSEPFRRVFPKYGMNLYGAWETVIGTRDQIIDMWQYESNEARQEGVAEMGKAPGIQEFMTAALPVNWSEDVQNIVPMPYCQEFRRLKTRAILYWKMRTTRDGFEKWTEIRSRFIPMAEEHGWVLAAAWSPGTGSGSMHQCTEAWFFEDQTRLLSLMARVEQDKKIQKVLAKADALLIEETKKLLRPTWYSPDYLG